MKIVRRAEVSLCQRVDWKPVSLGEVCWNFVTQLHRVCGRMSISNREQTNRLKLPLLSNGFGDLLCDPRMPGNSDGWKGETLLIPLQEKFFAVPSVKQDAKKIVIELGRRAHSDRS